MKYPKYFTDNLVYAYKVINPEESLQINFVEYMFSIRKISTAEALGNNQVTEIKETEFYEIFDIVWLHLNEHLSTENKHYQREIKPIEVNNEALNHINKYSNFVSWNHQDEENKTLVKILLLIILGLSLFAFACVGFWNVFIK